LTLASQHDVNDETSKSWVEEIETMREVLGPYEGRGSVYFEYNIPRMGRRVDVIAVIDGIVFVLEYKTSERKFSREALVQVWDYAIDLKNFQEGSLERILIPILVVPAEKSSRCQTALKHFGDYVYEPLQVNTKRLAEAIEMVLGAVCYDVAPTQTDDQWAKSGYSPTPTIIEAAIALYEENTVEDITKHGGDIDKASVELCKIIDHCRANNRKAICFITGVPGAGKTLIGLNTAIDQFNRGEKAVYLSGNFPLVEVLQEALTRDYVRRDKKRAKDEGRKACTKAERLKAIGINVRYQPNFVHWFLEDDTDIRSSNCLEDTLTEFKVQGLEIDWACVTWDADLRLKEDWSAWQHFQLRSGTKWQRINKEINKEYQINAYRVLLTRARQGMVIVVPNGDDSVPPDETRKPEWYDGIYDYLKSVGIREL